MRFLIAEEEQALGVFLIRGLEAEGHEVVWARDGDDVLEKLEGSSPELVILDLNLPKRDGTEVLRAIRAWRTDLPVMVLTSSADTETRIACFDLGADDFMAKPFSMRELRARCRALLRRHKSQLSSVLRCGGLELNRIDRTVRRDNKAISLTNKEFALLECLMANRGRCVSRSTLLERVWQTQGDGNTNVVDVYVNYLRRKLHDTHGCSIIQTVRGVGYIVNASDPDREAFQFTSLHRNDSAAMPLSATPWETYGDSFGTQQHISRIAGQL